MEQALFAEELKKKTDNVKMIGAGLSIEFHRNNKKKINFKNQNIIIQRIDLSDRIAKKLFVIDAVALGATKILLADALGISRQSIHNYLEIIKKFGLEGLIAGGSPKQGKNSAAYHKQLQSKRMPGSKADILSEERKAKRINELQKQQEFDFEFGEKSVPNTEQPYNAKHDWEFTRFAGVFPYLIVLISQNKWLKLIMGYFGSAYKIFLIFLLMAARNIKSIEQLKNVNHKEAGLLLGLEKFPHVKAAWKWFYAACSQERSISLCKSYFKNQFACGLVNGWIWFTDGHLLPYTGKKKVRSGYNTQRKMMMPGQTNMVTCDTSGRIVDFQIQEGKGDLKKHIVALKKEWTQHLEEIPIMVFDREGYGAPFFYTLIDNQIPFVTWEKNVDSKKLMALDDELFAESFKMNGKKYSVFEGEKKFTVEENDDTHTFVLRKIYLWNKTSQRRTCCLAWDAGSDNISSTQCAKFILTRWGASENTFKHIRDRHPFHYHPGFKTTNSENQLIANPAIKSIDQKNKAIRKALDKKHRQNSKANPAFNKDGSVRENSVKARLDSEIIQLEAKYKELLAEKKTLPETVNVSDLENYDSFKKVNNEGKYLFDFVTASVWNARKEMTDWLFSYYPHENEYVDLFYAITQCHGWVKTETDRVVVRLEPLQQPSRRKAQEQFCKRLTSLNAYVPIGKILQIEVGFSPI